MPGGIFHPCRGGMSETKNGEGPRTQQGPRKMPSFQLDPTDRADPRSLPPPLEPSAFGEPKRASSWRRSTASGRARRGASRPCVVVTMVSNAEQILSRSLRAPTHLTRCPSRTTARKRDYPAMRRQPQLGRPASRWDRVRELLASEQGRHRRLFQVAGLVVALRAGNRMGYGIILLVVVFLLVYRYCKLNGPSRRSKSIVVGILVATFLIPGWLPGSGLIALLLQVGVGLYVGIYMQVTSDRR